VHYRDAVPARVRKQVRILGEEAAPQVATAADLYFALSDMDARVARMVLSGDTDAPLRAKVAEAVASL